MKKVFLQELPVKYEKLVQLVQLAFVDDFNETAFQEYYSCAFYFVNQDNSGLDLVFEVLNYIFEDIRNGALERVDF